MTFELTDITKPSIPSRTHVQTANGALTAVEGAGTIDITPTLQLPNCLYVPSLSHKLLSISHVTRALNCAMIIHPSFCYLQDTRTGEIIGRGTERNGLYYVDEIAQPSKALFTSTSTDEEALLWHRRFGHPSIGYIAHYNTELPNHNFQKDYNGISSFQLKGQDLEYRYSLVLLTLVDLSSNRLSGNIPDSFSNMKGLISLNLSRNNLTGNIIHDVGQMRMLECLDLSDNQLSGEIPKSMANLSFLSFLNLSNNKLSGKIPSSTQLQSFNISSYAKNEGLCGRPMALCPSDRLRPPTTTHGDRGDGFWRLSFMQGFVISMVFGLIVGFWGVIGCLLLKKSWRFAYFSLVDDIGDSLCVRISSYLSKYRGN